MKGKETNKFEQIIHAEISDMDLDHLLDNGEVSSEVSEIVGEKAGESIPVSEPKTKKTGFAQISQKITSLLFKSAKSKQKLMELPSVQVQKQEVKKSLVKKTRKLISQATKLQNEKNFSAEKLEQILLEIRHLRQVIANLISITKEKMERLYRKHVLKEG
ncbi:hypothetical protein KAI58_04650 [Candidatus Gracilibacteria bacterium]|nr:hypothetical protein [Candidatus Gracilibacteria bacterium]